MHSWFQQLSSGRNVSSHFPVPSQPIFPFLETLEARIAPAAVVSPKAFTYTEADGDEVTVSFGQGILDGLSNEQLNDIFKFGDGSNSSADANPFGNTSAQTLREIDLSDIPGVSPEQAAKIKIEIKAKKGPAGDGLANVGLIRTDFDLEKIKVSGDVAKIEIGDGDATTAAAKTIEVGSWGVRGVEAFGGTFGVDDLVSVIRGPVGTIKVKGDIDNARITVSGPPGGETVKSFDVGGQLTGSETNGGQVTIEGNAGLIAIKGGIVSSVANLADDSAVLSVTGSVKTLSTGSILGGEGANSGRVSVSGNIEFFGVQGDIKGGDGVGSGKVEADGKIRKADVKGGVEGGVGDQSGVLRMGSFDALAVGTIEGGAGFASGGIVSEAGGKTFKTKADENGNALIGGAGDASGFFLAGDSVGSVAFGGAITAEFSSGVNVAVCDIDGDGINDVITSFTVKGGLTGSGEGSAVVELDGFVKTVKLGAIAGGSGEGSGVVKLGSFGAFSAGPIFGGGTGSGGIWAEEGGLSLVLGADENDHSLRGGAGAGSGFVTTGDVVKSVAFAGGIDGAFGGGVNTAVCDFNGDGTDDVVTKVTVGGDVRGGAGSSGSVMVGGFVKAFSLDDFFAGSGETVLEMNGAGSLQVKNDLIGSANVESGKILVHGDVKTLYVAGARGGTVEVDGDVGSFKNKFGAYANPSAPMQGLSINVDGSLGSASFGGPAFHLIMAVAGNSIEPEAPALKALSIKGDAVNVSILGGYSNAATPINPDARIDSIKITGNVTNSLFAAGVQDSGDMDNVPDQFIGGASESLSRILSVVIGGFAAGSSFVSGHVVGVSIDGQKISLQEGSGNDEVNSGGVLIREVPAA